MCRETLHYDYHKILNKTDITWEQFLQNTHDYSYSCKSKGSVNQLLLKF